MLGEDALHSSTIVGAYVTTSGDEQKSYSSTKYFHSQHWYAFASTCVVFNLKYSSKRIDEKQEIK
eukprot:scaffold19337_cov89-Skeletonema_dohrnii-CCMP3373.AAC.1